MYELKHSNTKSMKNQGKVTFLIDHNSLIMDSKDVEMDKMSDK